MKRKSSKSLFTLLTKNYIVFMLSLIAAALCVYLLWELSVSIAIKGKDISAVMNCDEFVSGDYDYVDVSRYIGRDGAFAIIGSDMRVIYSSSEDFDAEFTKGELSCIPKYGSDYYVDYMEFPSEDGKKQYLLTLNSVYDSSEHKTVRIMVLDENLKVISGGFSLGKASYTPEEFDYLTGRWSDEYLLYKAKFNDSDGNEMTLLVRCVNMTGSYYNTVISKSHRIFLLLIPFYFLITVFFILWMNRTIRRPLAKLEYAIVTLGEGKPAKAINCGGPYEIQHLGESFDEMALKLSASEQERRGLELSRQKLITDISHDLKTPITIISGYTNAIRDGKIPPEELPRYLDVVDAKVKALTELINSFYEYSKTEHPDFRLDCKNKDICEFLRQYIAEKYDEIDLAGFSLDLNIPEDPIICAIDSFQLRRAIDNIIANSLKHNTLGTLIRISLSKASGKVIINIADNGNGIPEQMREHIFEPFVVGDESRTNGGSGLGLAIARKIIEAHGGIIRLMKLKDLKGTAFEILLRTAKKNNK